MDPRDLVQALTHLPPARSPDLLVGPSTLDDAGIVRLADGLALVQTVDFFPPVVDDPEWYGRIAAANALSDVYAMGGRPHSVLSIVGWPKGLSPDLLGRILAGGQEKIDEAEAILAGGHTVTDAEIKYGLAVTGTCDPEHILTNAKVEAGDLLLLTKSIGMGAVTTALKKGRLSEDRALAAMEQMATLNRAAGETLVELGLRAATDVTGFGLLGHAKELADASGVSLRISASEVPVFPGALELSRSGLLSGGAARTRAYLGKDCRVEPGVPEPLAGLCFDAETSGGLLAAFPPSRRDEVLAALAERGVEAFVLGEAFPREEVVLRLEP